MMGRMYSVVTICMAIFLSMSGLSYGCSSSFTGKNLAMNCKLPNSKDVKIKIRLAEIRELYPFRDDKIWTLWGEYPAPSKNFGIRVITITINGKKTFVPFSVYADLLNPTAMTIKESGDTVNILIDGGSDGASYSAVLVLKESPDKLLNVGYIVKKRVYDHEFPDQLFEEVTYGYVEGN